MRHPPLAPGWIDRLHLSRHVGDLPLESGEVLRDCKLVWVEHGKPNAARDNTVLVCCAIGSTHHRLDFLIGEGRALDPARWHVVAVDALGNGLSSSPSNSATQPGAAFPAIGIRDMVQSQARLLDALGVGRLAAVVGASMGGMQALQWAASHPARVESVVAMTPMARASRWSQLVNEIARRCLFEDAACRRPRERASAMRLWAPFTQLVVATSPRSVEALGDRAALMARIAQVESWFTDHGPDPFDWLAQSRAYDHHDIGDALGAIRARTLVLAPPLDLYNPEWAARELAARIPGATFLEIPSANGHRAATATSADDAEFLNRAVESHLVSES